MWLCITLTSREDVWWQLSKACVTSNHTSWFKWFACVLGVWELFARHCLSTLKIVSPSSSEFFFFFFVQSLSLSCGFTVTSLLMIVTFLCSLLKSFFLFFLLWKWFLLLTIIEFQRTVTRCWVFFFSISVANTLVQDSRNCWISNGNCVSNL